MEQVGSLFDYFSSQKIFAAVLPISGMNYARDLLNTAQLISVRGDRKKILKFRFFYALLLIFGVHLLILFFYPPIDFYYQLLSYNLMTINQIPDFFKPLFCIGIMLTIHSYDVIFFKSYHNRITKLFVTFLYNPEKSLLWPHYKQIVKKVLMAISLYRFLPVVVIFWLLFALVRINFLFWYELNVRVELPVFMQVLCFVSLNTLGMIDNCSMFLIVNMFTLGSELTIIASIFMSNLINMADQILIKASNSEYCSLWRVSVFLRRHQANMALLFDVNNVFGPLFLYFILLNIPTNLLMLNVLILHQLEPLIWLSILAITLMQMNVIFGLHWVASVYTKKVHRPFKRLIRINMSFTKLPFGKRFKIAKAIEMYHTRNPYGLTYGSIGLMSNATFGKFVIYYMKFLIITYKNYRAQTQL